MTFPQFAARFVVTMAFVSTAASGWAQQPAVASPAALSTAIADLGSFDLKTRTEAARTLRRAPAATVAADLERAARTHKDEYVRFRALVLLAGMKPDIRPLMQELMTDRNDRVRTVAYQWFEHHPEPAAIPALVAALGRERSEFIRPAVMRALAAHGDDSRVRTALVPLISRGEDLFRGALLEALGDYRAAYATADIAAVAKLDGPLQDDAVTALGKIGDASARPILVALQKSATEDVQPTVSAAFCLMKIDCERQEAFLKESLRFALQDAGSLPLLRGVAHALGMLAMNERPWALGALLDAAAVATDGGREPLALTIGLVSLRRPALLLDVVSGRAETAKTLDVLLEAFDMLSEDFEEERFYVEIRNAFWSAPEGSPRRKTAEAVIATLEF